MDQPMKLSGMALLEAVRDDPASIYVGKIDFADFLAALAAQAEKVGSDVSSASARKRITSTAYSVTRTKTILDDAGKALTESKRREIASVDAQRREIRNSLDTLRDEVKRPVTQWEEQEEARVASHEAQIKRIDRAAVVLADTTAKDLEERIRFVEGLDTSEHEMQEYAALATKKCKEVLAFLRSTLERATVAEAERAELAKLRAAQAEREAEDRRREDEARRVAEREAVEAEIKAREEAAAARAKEAAERAAQEAAQRAAEAAERERLAAEAEANRKAQDARYRASVIRKAEAALVKHAGLDKQQATDAIGAVLNGQIPNLTLSF
ncbi:hypothetical protein ATO13_22411 [Stappia sp. 22II-S9-Z10]|nr:hypothetical protein ATO13_22411 [Stappia sp. 22II-S9-Z10]